MEKGLWKLSVLSVKFFCKSKAALKKSKKDTGTNLNRLPF